MRRRGVVAFLSLCLVVFGSPTIGAPEPSMPDEIGGLKVGSEKLVAEKQTDREYLEEIHLFSLRRGKQLEGTIQLGRFRASAPVDEAGFRRSIASQVGTTVPVEHRVNGDTVYVTKSKRLSIAVWFEAPYMFVLSIRETYGSPKRLIRSALEVHP
jgi:hypothetical protein